MYYICLQLYISVAVRDVLQAVREHGSDESERAQPAASPEDWQKEIDEVMTEQARAPGEVW